MLLTYKNLKIRNATAEDAEQLCRWWNDGAVMAHAGFPNGLNTNTEKIIGDLSSDSDDTYRRLMIEQDNLPIGEMSCRNMGNGIAEIGIKICETDKQEKGCGTLLLQMLITHLFASGYEKIVLDTNLKNTRAQHVYEKLGFKQSQIHYDAWRDQLGELQSTIDYELLRSQFVPLADLLVAGR